MIILQTKKCENILKYLTEFEGLSYNKVQILFRKKDIKVNGKRVDAKFDVKKGDKIEIFCKNDYFFNISTIFEDENIIIVSKPKKLEVISETKNISLLNLINPEYFAVHRLDFNTEGLVVFAKNLSAKTELDFAFKNSLVQKSYITICTNSPQNSIQLFEDFLVKKNNCVEIYNTNVPNSKKILTKIEVLKIKTSQVLNDDVLNKNILNENIINNKNLNNKNSNNFNNNFTRKDNSKINERNNVLINKQTSFSLLKVDLLTGRTHQIRAHLAFHNLCVLGDEKYGNFFINKKLNIKTQILRAYMLKFNNINGKLSYLNGKIFEIPTNDIYEMFENL